ncbi:stomatin family protein [Scheffersomyces stipitis CBS 6054]|uniref:Stomatin family protein n=1 Tax=Scheffersomyces stipitis (strain ATCC 58785 / CBS 6054 / NBRC 10063 / NRRL Y-11545) TaxID=322104 RepID=A3LTY5_PICST|nr:stomatin family protein [Scheffersomyces stipitis CBS 6054]ABN66493.2 stomatin family protein [Scheffersomyces stipitis CBS 6054]
MISTIAKSAAMPMVPVRAISIATRANSSNLLTAFARARSNSGALSANFTRNLGGNSNGYSSTLNFFQREQLPTNTVIRFVPQQTAWVVERMGKFHRILQPGLTFLIPILDKITYVQSLKESAIEIPSQNAITSDNVSLELDGILYIKVIDPYKASYGVEDFKFAISQLAQTTMRSEIGSMTLDAVLKERQLLNNNINHVINDAARDNWGVECLRYEIRDIHPPQNVLDAMHRQVSAERSKRAEILESEGQRQSKINISEGEKQSIILASEANKEEQINQAAGEAQSILLKSEATAKGLKLIAQAIKETPGGAEAVNLQVAQEYIKQFGNLAKETNTVIIPQNLGDLGGMITSGLSLYENLNKAKKNV